VTNNANVEPGLLYKVSCEVRVLDWHGPAFLQVADKTTGKLFGTVSITNHAWETHTFEFRSPVAGAANMAILINGGYGGGPQGKTQVRNPQVKQFSSHVVDDALVLNVLLEFANYVRLQPELENRFGAFAREWVKLAKEIAHQWEGNWVEEPGEDRTAGVYLVPDDGSQGVFARASLPLNQFAIAGLVHWGLFKYSGDAFYLARTRKLGEAFLRYLEPTTHGYTWPYYKELFPDGGRRLSPIASRSEDLAHSNLTIAFALSLYEERVLIGDVEMARLLDTFLRQIYEAEPSGPRMARAVSGLGSGYYAKLPEVWWWLKLAGLNPDVLHAVSASVEKDVGIDVSGPVHSELGVWSDQGWRILLKSMLAYYFRELERERLGPALAIVVDGSQGVSVSWPAWFRSYRLESSGGVAGGWRWAEAAENRSSGRFEAQFPRMDSMGLFRLHLLR